MDFRAADTGSDRASGESLRREMSQMEVLDPVPPASQMSARISKHISNLTSGLSALNLPFRDYFSSLRLRDVRLPEELQPSWILLMRIIGLLLVFGMGYLLFFSDILHLRNRTGYSVPLQQVSGWLQQHVNASRIRENLEHATQFDHIAGTEGSYFLAKWIEGEMTDAGWEDVRLERFDVYLNYPRPNGRSVAIVAPPELAWTATLEEELAYTDPPREQTLAFHGHSKSGNATGPLVYANFGAPGDFDLLRAAGVDLTGAIVLMRYYGTQPDRSLKVRAAAQAGAAGALLYSDPQQDGFATGAVWPDGPSRPADGVQRGSVALTAWIVGDPLSPGFASTPDEGQRLSPAANPALVTIPSLPLAWRDAQPLLQSLKGKGIRLTDPSWTGGVPDVEWWSGSAQSPTVHVQNEQDEVERQPIYNVLARLEGREQPEKTVTLGAHYDAWCFGATDPGSGTAVQLELVRLLGELRRLGWQPRRTIQVAAWDAEEYNLVGSTEHVEARLDELRRDGIAYVNVDIAAGGTAFRAAGSPLLQRALHRVLDRVPDPARADGAPLRKSWEADSQVLGTLGAGSDYVAWQALAGVSAIDVTFAGLNRVYHSCYDSFAYMAAFGDAQWAYHAAMAQVLGLLVLECADEPLLPFDLQAYADVLGRAVDELGTDAATLDLAPLRAAQGQLADAADKMRRYAEGWVQTVDAMGGFESMAMTGDRLRFNAAVAQFETGLLDVEHGLPNRTQYKHVVFAPALGDGYSGATFPGVRDALRAGDRAAAQAEVERAAGVIGGAVGGLPI